MTKEMQDQPPDFARIRVFVEEELGPQQVIVLSPNQSHYVKNVMRQSVGDHIRVFNGRHGEWDMTITADRKNAVELSATAHTRMQDAVPPVLLAFSPIKKSPMDYLVEKATELGVRTLQPLLMDRTQVHAVRPDKLRARAIEAAEQSWRLSVPEIAAPEKLDTFLNGLTRGQPVLFCDERRAQSGAGPSPVESLRAAPATEAGWVILIGPEGGFSPREQGLIEQLPGAVPLSLGPRIMRAETAAVAALTLWQAVLGDLKILSN